MQRRMPRAERRSQLIEVATEKFGERGYGPTSMDDIATAAGITKPVVYQHFDSKEDLYIAVLDTLGETLEDRILDISNFSGTSRERIRAGITMFFEFVDSQSSILRLFFGNEFATERVEEKVENVLNRAAQSVGQVLMQRRKITSEDALVLGTTLVASIQATARLSQGRTVAEREHALDVLTAVFTDGISDYDEKG